MKPIRISLRTVQERKSMGLEPGISTSQHVSSRKMVRPRTPEESRGAIIDALAAAGHPLTRLQIATAIDRQKSPHLVALLEEMVADGDLVRHVDELENGLRMYFYEVNHADD